MNAVGWAPWDDQGLSKKKGEACIIRHRWLKVRCFAPTCGG
jgi:hypothetical protein